MRISIVLITILILAALVACERTDHTRGPSATFLDLAENEIAREVIKETPVERLVTNAVTVESEEVTTQMPVVARVYVGAQSKASHADGDEEYPIPSTISPDTILVSQQRIIARTVDIGLKVSDVSATMDQIASLANDMGGWIVTADRSHKHQGFISVRVPADNLDDSVARLRAMADEVESEVSTSKDVTDEYVDLTARLSNLKATGAALVKLLDRANKVEDALEVQRELTTVQGDIESLQGRIKFLEQTSAFSLVNVRLTLKSQEVSVDSGSDQTTSVGKTTRFRASFDAPTDIERYEYTWDFGDGSDVVYGHRTAPTLDKDIRVTATVTHMYRDDHNSPYITEFKITGFGDAGVVEGNDTLIVSVTELPTVEVFAGEDQVVENGEEVEFAGTFTRPKGLSEVTFEWDFGDGSSPVTDSVTVGETSAIATHAYRNHRPTPYKAILTITAQARGGEIESVDSVSVFVTESIGWTVSGWSASDTWKTATRALSSVGQTLGSVGIWIVIFSPAWLTLAILVFALRRRRRWVKS